MNCLTTFVVHYYHLRPKAWEIVLRVIRNGAEEFPYQGGVMVRKILSENMVGLDGREECLIQICVQLVRSKNN